MSIIKRGKIYHVRFTGPDGKRVSRSARTTNKGQAKEFKAKLESRLWREHQLGESQATWQDAVLSWLNSTTHKSRQTVLIRLRWLDQHLNGLLVREITTDLLHRVRDAKLTEGVKQATANRYLSVASTVLHHAKSRGWIHAVPNIPMVKEPKRKLRYLTKPEADKLISVLRSRPRSAHLVDMVIFSLATGLRESNVTGMQWAWIDPNKPVAWVPSETTKNSRALRVPLNQSAQDVLDRRRGEHDDFVFSYRGRKLAKAGHDGFRSAVADCGWDDVTWHTLRHTWASWHAMAGTPLQVLMELGGWSSFEMVLRYAHLSPDHLDSFAENVAQNWRNAK